MKALKKRIIKEKNEKKEIKKRIRPSTSKKKNIDLSVVNESNEKKEEIEITYEFINLKKEEYNLFENQIKGLKIKDLMIYYSFKKVSINGHIEIHGACLSNSQFKSVDYDIEMNTKEVIVKESYESGNQRNVPVYTSGIKNKLTKQILKSGTDEDIEILTESIERLKMNNKRTLNKEILEDTVDVNEKQISLETSKIINPVSKKQRIEIILIDDSKDFYDFSEINQKDILSGGNNSKIIYDLDKIEFENFENETEIQKSPKEKSKLETSKTQNSKLETAQVHDSSLKIQNPHILTPKTPTQKVQTPIPKMPTQKVQTPIPKISTQKVQTTISKTTTPSTKSKTQKQKKSSLLNNIKTSIEKRNLNQPNRGNENEVSKNISLRERRLLKRNDKD